MKKGEMSAGLKAARGRTLSFVGGGVQEDQQPLEEKAGKDAAPGGEEAATKVEPAAPTAAKEPDAANDQKTAFPAEAAKPAKEQPADPATPPPGASAGAEANHQQAPAVVYGRAPWPLVHFEAPELESPPPGYETAATVVNFRLPTKLDKTIDQHIAMLDTNKSEWIRRALLHQLALEREILQVKLAAKS